MPLTNEDHTTLERARRNLTVPALVPHAEELLTELADRASQLAADGSPAHASALYLAIFNCMISAADEVFGFEEEEIFNLAAISRHVAELMGDVLHATASQEHRAVLLRDLFALFDRCRLRSGSAYDLGEGVHDVLVFGTSSTEAVQIREWTRETCVTLPAGLRSFGAWTGAELVLELLPDDAAPEDKEETYRWGGHWLPLADHLLAQGRQEEAVSILQLADYDQVQVANRLATAGLEAQAAAMLQRNRCVLESRYSHVWSWLEEHGVDMEPIRKVARALSRIEHEPRLADWKIVRKLAPELDLWPPALERLAHYADDERAKAQPLRVRVLAALGHTDEALTHYRSLPDSSRRSALLDIVADLGRHDAAIARELLTEALEEEAPRRDRARWRRLQQALADLDPA